MTSAVNTQWVFNDQPTELYDFSFNVNFVIAPVWSTFNCQKLYTVLNQYGKYVLYAKSGSSNLQLYYWYNSSQSYSVESWYKYIWIRGGDDVDNPDFIAWLEANATRTDVLYKGWSAAFKSTADAIRSKAGTTDSIAWNQDAGFSSAINNIVIGKDGNAFPFDLMNGVIAYSKNAKLTGTIMDANGVSF